MQEYQGTIKKVYNNKGRWSLLMDDENWYGNGYQRPNAEEGQEAKFQWSQNDRGYRDIKQGTLRSRGAPSAPAEQKGAKAGANRGNAAAREQFWADKEARDIDTQKRISFQAAVNSALTLVNAAMERELISIPKSKKASEKLDAYVAIVMEQAEELFRTYQNLPDNYEEIMGNSDEQEQEQIDGLQAGDEPPFDSGEDDDWD